jgi:hypothetical protein
MKAGTFCEAHGLSDVSDAQRQFLRDMTSTPTVAAEGEQAPAKAH